MRIEQTHYVIMKIGDIGVGDETKYMSYESKDDFTNDILTATRFANRTAALYAKTEYERDKNHSYESGMHIIPVKITYEW